MPAQGQTVLLVDDSAAVRHLLARELASQEGIEVIGTAPNGRAALESLTRLAPDAVVLDVEMPEMDGLRALAEIRKSHPTLPVIMLSTLTRRGATATLDALALGANDYVAKPGRADGTSGQVADTCAELADKIRTHVSARAAAAAPRNLQGSGQSSTSKVVPTFRRIMSARAPVSAVVIGVSTGGPAALAEVIPSLPASFPAAVLIAQHMPSMFTKVLSERLSAKSQMPVVEARSGEALGPGKVRIAPGDQHLVLHRSRFGVELLTNRNPRENSCRPSVDVLFRSAAEALGACTLGVVLTGMGQDGLLGSEAIVRAGGQVIVQDEATSVVWGMPGLVARSGFVHQVVPLHEMAAEILRRVQSRVPFVERTIRTDSRA